MMPSYPATAALEQFLEEESCLFPAAVLPEFETTTLFQALDDDALSFPTIAWCDDSDSDSCCSFKSSDSSKKSSTVHKKSRRSKHGLSRSTSCKMHALVSLAQRTC
mmetsp:Transcript_24943/g.47367  ORF Transcript_24943/g.47367 Transcript_24943/m.47367 type:complete len:106 (-) Transcript_24943:344-661(-)